MEADGGTFGTRFRRSQEELAQLLMDLVDRLVEKGQPAQIYVIGGAGVGMAFYPEGIERRPSNDIDCLYFPRAEIRVEAEAMAVERGLPLDWFNNKAAGFLPPSGRPPGERLFSRGDVEVFVAPARFLLAMKLRACRLGRDQEDIAVLVRYCGIRSFTEAEALVDEVYDGEEEIPPQGRALVDVVLGEFELVQAKPPVVLPAVAPREPNARA